MKRLAILAFVAFGAMRADAQTVQCQTTNGAWGPCPLNASVQLFNAISATGTQTATAQKVYNFNLNGNLLVTWASITGSPSGCTLQVKSGDSLGNLINNGSAISVTPSNGTTSTAFTPALAQQNADQAQVVYSCSVYPSTGTLSVEFVPDASDIVAANYGTSPGAVPALSANAFVTNTVSDNVAQFGGSPVSIGQQVAGSSIPVVLPSAQITTLTPPTTVTSNQGTANTAASAWPAKVTDGTNVAAVKAASTAAAATDPALVVAVSPNNTVAATQSGNWTARVVGNSGSTIDAAIGAATAPTNQVVTGGVFNTSLPTLTTGQSAAIQLDSSGRQLVAGSQSNNGAAAGSNRAGVLPALAQSTYAAGTAYTAGRDAGETTGTDGLLWTANLPSLRPASYEASANFAASSTTDNACIYGNATNTVVLYEVDVSGVQTTASIVNVQLIRRSAAETGGTSANMTSVRGDVTNYSAASTTPVSYTGTGPTAGTAVGTIDQKYTGFLATSTVGPDDLYQWNGRLKPQALIGTSQGICVNIGNAALTGGNMDVVFRWLEITNISE